MEEAVVDVEASQPGGPFYDLLVDFTSCMPTAQWHRAAAARRAGATSAAAEAAKLEDYPPRSGKRVQPAAVELFGSLGPGCEEFLRALAAEAARRDELRGLPPIDWEARWRDELAVGVAHAVARTCLGARTGSGRDPTGEAQAHPRAGATAQLGPHPGAQAR